MITEITLYYTVFIENNILTDIISENQLSDFEIVYKFSTKKKLY